MDTGSEKVMQAVMQTGSSDMLPVLFYPGSEYNGSLGGVLDILWK